MNDSDLDLKTRRKIIVQIALILFVSWIIGNWVSTMIVAHEVNCDPALGFNILGIYPPWMYSSWCSDPQLVDAMPHVLGSAKKWTTIMVIIGGVISYQVFKASQKHTSHGSAEWAKEADIVKAGLGAFTIDKKKTKLFGFIPWEKEIKTRKESGVVAGIDPFTGELMLHNGPEHMLLMAPTRSGKGVNTIIPTGLIWKNSIFFFDPKGELWQSTSGYRQKVLKQKVLKFQPLRDDGSGVRWNPLAEVEFRHQDEISDIETIVGMLVKPGGEKEGGKDPFWDNAAGSVLKGVIMHLMYARYADGQRRYFLWRKEYQQIKRRISVAEGKVDAAETEEAKAKEQETLDNLRKSLEEKLAKKPCGTPLPCLTDVMTFLSPADAEDLGEYFRKNAWYPHITSEEFLERKILDDDGNPVLDAKGNPMYYENPLKTVYGSYVTNLVDINNKLNEKARANNIKKTFRCLDIDDVRKAILEIGGSFDFGEGNFNETDIDEMTENPFRVLLTHPKVSEAFANIANNAEQTRASILGTATTALTLYQNPVVQKNTAVSDFCIRDLLNPAQEVSLYLVMEPKDIAILKPLSRLFINTMLDKLVRDMKFELNANTKKQRLLLMLDEFPQLGNMQKVELSLAICAGYGIKMCIVSQDVNQLNKEYTKDNSIGSNCHVHIYFTPNLDSGGATAESISKILGKKTITTTNHSDGGGFFKGSDSYSQTGRELMTPDEVSKLPATEEIVFVAGNKPIHGNKLRYYEHKFFTDKIKKNGFPEFSDKCTAVATYEDLFAIHAADWADRAALKEKIMEAKIKAGIVNDPRVNTKGETHNEEKEDTVQINLEGEGEETAQDSKRRTPSPAQGPWGNRPNKMMDGGYSSNPVSHRDRFSLRNREFMDKLLSHGINREVCSSLCDPRINPSVDQQELLNRLDNAGNGDVSDIVRVVASERDISHEEATNLYQTEDPAGALSIYKNYLAKQSLDDAMNRSAARRNRETGSSSGIGSIHSASLNFKSNMDSQNAVRSMQIKSSNESMQAGSQAAENVPDFEASKAEADVSIDNLFSDDSPVIDEKDMLDEQSKIAPELDNDESPVTETQNHDGGDFVGNPVPDASVSDSHSTDSLNPSENSNPTDDNPAQQQNESSDSDDPDDSNGSSVSSESGGSSGFSGSDYDSAHGEISAESPDANNSSVFGGGGDKEKASRSEDVSKMDAEATELFASIEAEDAKRMLSKNFSDN